MRSLVIAALVAAGPAVAEGVNITPDMPSVTIETSSGPVEISRIQDPENVVTDPENVVTGEWAKTSRPCPNFCIQPMSPAPGVTTIGELELIALLQDPETTVVDSRTPDWYMGGTIPGAVNMPYTEMTDRLGELGCELDFEGWDCTNARQVALFCNGLWCGQSPEAIRRMIDAGYPAERISYYRGGMQSWRVLGLTVAQPGG